MKEQRTDYLKTIAKFLERYGLIIWTILCLVSLLAYTFTHTSTLLGRYASPLTGRIAAFGIEASIIGMSIRIGRIMFQLRSSKSDKALWFSLVWQGGTLLFVLAVTAVAQVVEGFEVRYGQPFTLDAIGLLDPVQALAGILATAVIPALVITLTEIVSGEIREAVSSDSTMAAVEVLQVGPALPTLLPAITQDATVAKELEIVSPDAAIDIPTKAKKAQPVANSTPTLDELLQERGGAAGYNSTKEAVDAYLDAHPHAKIAELLDAFPGKARGTLSGYLSNWQKARGVVATNGNGRG